MGFEISLCCSNTIIVKRKAERASSCGHILPSYQPCSGAVLSLSKGVRKGKHSLRACLVTKVCTQTPCGCLPCSPGLPGPWDGSTTPFPASAQLCREVDPPLHKPGSSQSHEERRLETKRTYITTLISN